MFAGLDLSSGYKSVGEVGLSLAVTAATALIPGGGSAGGSGVKEIIKAGGIAAAKSYAVSVGTNYLGAINLDKIGTEDWIDSERLEAANESWYSVETIAGAISAGVAAGVGTAFGGMDKASAKFLSGSVKLATAAAGEAAKYGVYAGYSLASEDWSDGDVFGHIGSALGNAYDEMGGLTINVANLGAMLDFVGTVAGRINGSGQSIFGDGSILESLGGIGLLEVNFGREGISASIGMGGIDVGGALYDQVKRGIDYAGLKELAKTGDAKTAEMSWDTYVYGDFTQENTAMRIASGKDELRFVDKDFGLDEEGRIRLGETTRSSGGGRIISITDIGDIDTMSVTLGHEAYRNGVVDVNNKEETRAAVIAHTKMAASMRAEGTSFGGNVALDLAVYDYARSVGNMEIMNKYADALYDSSGEYWKLKINPNGTFELKDDDRSSLYLENGDGSEFKLWDMDNLDKWDAYQQIKAFSLRDDGHIRLSSETMKRLGLYTILNANDNNLSTEQFEDIVSKSYLNKNGLGYYIDFSNALEHINQNLPDQYISDARKSLVQFPDYSYTFNPAAIKNIFTYGIMGTLGYTATVSDNPYFKKQNNSYDYPEYHIETEDGNLSFGWDRILKDYNNQDVKFTKVQPSVTGLIGLPNVIPQSSDKLTVFGYVAIAGMQFFDGAVKARNIDNIHVNTWNILGQSFFTMQTTVLSSMQSTNAKFVYKFVTAEESKTGRYERAAKEYAKKYEKK